METTASKTPVKKTLQSTRRAAAKTAVKAEPAARTKAKAPAAKPAKKSEPKLAVKADASVEAKAKRQKKEKVVRDSFTMPKSEYAKLASLKQKCLDNGVRVKKSELLRAALAMLDGVPPKRLLAAVNGLEAVKTGRPSNA
ncbi:hypothetical protein [Caballeronia humi]|jgi:hypothetical protein|uniref:Uncharacterized protein n=1 Tax=Caballeronia humi TaxID=326474 RepID=A0A158HTY4_9BURK|nr:hypothetical protein [Caballeronia humi]SAL47828.1 hypothetical protein AWB65_03824 [Caballeronia humi]